MQRFCKRLGIRLYRPTYRILRGDPVKQAEAKVELAELRAKAEAGELVLLSRDEARFPMVPTLTAALGVKGHRPTVGTRDCKDLLYVFGVVNVVTGASADDGAAAPLALGKLSQTVLPRLSLLWADAKYHNHALDRWVSEHGWYVIQVRNRPPGSEGFVLLIHKPGDAV